MYSNNPLSHLSLGKSTYYPNQYNNQLLQSVPRTLNRDALGISHIQPFVFGSDIWTIYELSWLNEKGVPQVAMANVYVDYRSENLIESKSFKLYLNSFNQTRFSSWAQIENILQQDLTQCAKGKVRIELFPLHLYPHTFINLEGECIDQQDIEIDNYAFSSHHLYGIAEGNEIEETLTSHLLKSNCLITNQPDWGSIQIHYIGKRLDHEKLLRYLVSFRQHNEFHEQCVERIFCDLLHFAQPKKLSVYARYTRRGGLDINPFRSNFESVPQNARLIRQ